MKVAVIGWGRYELGLHLSQTMRATGRERTLTRVVDALHDTCDVGDDLWSTARGVLDEPQLLDLLRLCDCYHAISFAARAVRVEPEPGAPRSADVVSL